jgi:DNA-binding response OmpR family regulator
MKIVIFNEDLRSEMQMYLALSNHYDVSIAEDENDLLQMLDGDFTDYMFLDLDFNSEEQNSSKRLEIARLIRKKHPGTQVVGICDCKDKSITERAAGHGIDKVVTRPIKNRELLEVID